MYKEVSKIIFHKLLEEKLISKEVEQEATNIIERELNNNIQGFEDCYLCGSDEFHDILSSIKKIKYHSQLLNVDSWYYDGSKFIVESNNKEYQIYNDLNLYVIEELEKDYIQVYDLF